MTADNKSTPRKPGSYFVAIDHDGSEWWSECIMAPTPSSEECKAWFGNNDAREPYCDFIGMTMSLAKDWHARQNAYYLQTWFAAAASLGLTQEVAARRLIKCERRKPEDQRVCTTQSVGAVVKELGRAKKDHLWQRDLNGPYIARGWKPQFLKDDDGE
jgi:hypothetical protein